MSLFRNSMNALMGLLGYVRATDSQLVDWGNRESLYAVNELLYGNKAYFPSSGGGALESILGTYFGLNQNSCPENVTLAARYPIRGHFAPFKEIVDVYQNCRPGVWGEATKVADKVDDKPVNPRLLEPLSRIWRMSNLNTEKGKWQRWAANFGTVGMRVVGRRAEPPNASRVSVRFDHPERLFNFEEDGEGNVTAACLKYKFPVNFGTLVDPDWTDVDVVETLTKTEFSRTYDGKEQLADGDRRNELGFCPYVILRHKDNGTPYGDWAYKGIEAAVHAINWRITRQSIAITRNEMPKWFGAGAGDKPAELKLGDDEMIYVKLDPDVPAPILEAMVPDLKYGDIRGYWEALIELVRRYNPEININDVRLLAGISGESLAQVLKATEAMVLAARPGYDHALIRAMQMAVSNGVALGMWDVGTGMGPEQAEAAYRQGKENFNFAPAPALPLTTFQQIQLATAAVAEDKAKFDLATAAQRTGVVSDRQVMRHAGMTDAQIKQNEKEISSFDLEDPAATQDFAGNGRAK